MKRIKLAVALAFFISHGCKPPLHLIVSDNEREMIKGDWSSVDDSSDRLKISSTVIMEYYNNQPIDTFRYELSRQPCDKAYMKSGNEKTLFLKKFKEKDNYSFCYEIMGLNKNNLTLVYTINPRISSFRRSDR